MNNIKQYFSNILINCIYSRDIKRYIAYNISRVPKRSRKTEGKDPIVLVPYIDWMPHLHIFSYVIPEMRKRYKAKICIIRIHTSIYQNLVFRPYLDKIYASFGVHHKITLRPDYKDIQQAKDQANVIYNSLNEKSDLLQVKYKNQTIGSIIYDSYLRFNSKPTLIMKDTNLKRIIFRSILIYELIDRFFSNNKVSALILGDVSYVPYGIIAAVSCMSNIDILSVHGDKLEITKFDCKNFWRRSPYYDFKKIFALQKNRKEKIRMGMEIALRRFADDKSTEEMQPYMNKDSFHANLTKKVLSNNCKSKVLVLLHDFFDAPNIFRWSLFPDFWEWITFLLKIAKDTDFEWYIKPHPNGIPGNEVVVDKLRKMFYNQQNLIFIPSCISNHQLIKEGVASVFTVYGSAGHEFPLYGVPVVNAGDNLHIGFTFNWHPKSIEEYTSLILNADKLRKSIDKKEIYEFYYMYFMHFQGFEDIRLDFMPKDAEKFYEQILPNIGDLKVQRRRNIYLHHPKTLTYMLDKDKILEAALKNYVARCLDE